MLGTAFVETRIHSLEDNANTGKDGKPLLDEFGLPKWKTKYEALEAKSEKQRSMIEMMHHAAKTNKHVEIEKMIKDCVINPNFRDKKGWTALCRAAKSGAVETVDVLIKLRADTNSVTAKLNSALHKASKQGHLQVATSLIAAKANLDLKNNGGTTPLMIAVMFKKEELVELLVKSKADVNAQKDVGYTALMIAARRGNMFAVNTLIQANASIDTKDKQKETALEKARKSNFNAIEELLLAHGAKDTHHPHASKHRSHHAKQHHHNGSHGGGYPTSGTHSNNGNKSSKG